MFKYKRSGEKSTLRGDTVIQGEKMKCVSLYRHVIWVKAEMPCLYFEPDLTGKCKFMHHFFINIKRKRKKKREAILICCLILFLVESI